MNINVALNRIILSILSDKKLQWTHRGKFDVLEKTIVKSLKSLKKLKNKTVYINLLVCRLNNHSLEDTYFLEAEIKDCNYKVILCYESKIKIPHTGPLINEVLTKEELADFVAVSETKTEEEKVYLLTDEDIIDDVIALADNQKANNKVAEI